MQRSSLAKHFCPLSEDYSMTTCQGLLPQTKPERITWKSMADPWDNTANLHTTCVGILEENKTLATVLDELIRCAN